MASQGVNMATAGTSSSTTAATSEETKYEINKQPICLIILGMAGSGKTHFVKKLTQLCHMSNNKPYVINLDPACREVPYHANIGNYKSNKESFMK